MVSLQLGAATLVIGDENTLHTKNNDFQHFWREKPMFGYIVSLQLSSATWLISIEILLRTSISLTNIFKNIINILRKPKSLSTPIITIFGVLTWVTYVWVYSVNSDELGNLDDLYQNFVKELKCHKQ